MDKQLEALEMLKAKLIKEGKLREVAEINAHILKRQHELNKPCTVIYVDFKLKKVIRIAA